MSGVINKVFGNGQLSEEVRGELRTFLLQMRNERNAFETAAERATSSIDRAEGLETPVARMEQTLERLESRLQDVDGLASRLANLDQQARAIAETQSDMGAKTDEANGQVANLRSDLDAVQAELSGLRQMALEAQGTESEVAQVLELGRSLQPMRAHMSELSQQAAELKQSVASLREQQEEGQRYSANAVAQLAAVEERYQEVSTGFRTMDERALRLEEAVEALDELAKGVPDVRRELGTLKALATYVAQKVAEVEQQRAAVDYATSQGERFAELLQRIDRDTKTQMENARFLTELQEQCAQLREDQEGLLSQCGSISERQHEIVNDDELRSRELTEMRDKVLTETREVIENFEFERERLERVTDQVSDLRSALGDVEQRFQSIEETASAMARVRADLGQVADRVAGLDSELTRLDSQASRISAADEGIDRIEESLEELTNRLTSVREPTMHSLDRAEERLADLSASFESLEARSNDLQAFSERVRALNQEIDQRESTMDRALSRLDQISSLRDEASKRVGDLDDKSRVLEASLDGVNSKLEQVRDMYDGLEHRTADLHQVIDSIARFEKKLAKWHATEAIVTDAIEDAARRQETVDALREDIHHMFTIAEQTSESVRGILTARAELEEGRDDFRELAAAVGKLRTERDQLSERKREFADIDERMAQAEALMIDIGSSLETLDSQKAFLDQVMETAGSLRFQTKQAEAFIAALSDQNGKLGVGPDE